MFCYSHIQPSIMFLFNTFNYRFISLICSNRGLQFSLNTMKVYPGTKVGKKKSFNLSIMGKQTCVRERIGISNKIPGKQHAETTGKASQEVEKKAT